MKKTCLIVLFTFFLYNAAFAQWTQKADFGGGERYGAVGFCIGNKIYIGTGADVSGNKKDFWEYDPANDIWTKKADFGGTARYYAVGFSIGTKGYIGTGLNGTPFNKDFWEYNPSTDTWTQKSDFGGTARSGAIGFSLGTKGYIGTGVDGTTTKDFWEYDPATDTWTQKADFGGIARQGAVCFTIGNEAYVGLGAIIKDFWKYNPSTDTWTQKADFGGNARSRAVGFSIGNKGYIGTGAYNFQSQTYFINDFWEYDTVTDTWIEKANCGGTVRACAVGFSIGNKGYIGTGTYANYEGYPVFLQDFWEYDPLEDGIDDELLIDNNQMTISPNPTTGKINIQIPQQFGQVKTLEIYNCMGQLQKEQNDITNIDISGFNMGLYFLLVTNEKGEKVRGKVLKQ